MKIKKKDEWLIKKWRNIEVVVRLLAKQEIKNYRISIQRVVQAFQTQIHTIQSLMLFPNL